MLILLDTAISQNIESYNTPEGEETTLEELHYYFVEF